MELNVARAASIDGSRLALVLFDTRPSGISDVSCPSDDVLRDGLRAARSAAVPDGLAAHVRNCRDCQARVSAWGADAQLAELLKQYDERTFEQQETPADSLTVLAQTPEFDTLTHRPEPLRQVGQYELWRLIGRGGVGEVYEAQHTRLKRRLAIKILSAKHSGDEQTRKRFFREMESVGRLQHPHVVHAYDAGEADGVLYLAMELVDGPNVERVARHLPQLAVADACEIVRQAALGLQHIDDHALIHRDLKPSNLLLSRDGVKITDLGMALLRNPDRDDSLTGSRVILGTADYMAPEQAELAHSVDIRADIYSLGCTLFRLLAGRPPYSHDGDGSVMKKLLAHVQLPIPDIMQVRLDVPQPLKLVLEKLLAKERRDRPANPAAVAAALLPFCESANLSQVLHDYEAAHAGKVPQDARATPPTRPRTTVRISRFSSLLDRPWRRLGLIAVLLTGSVLGLVLLAGQLNRSDSRADRHAPPPAAPPVTGDSGKPAAVAPAVAAPVGAVPAEMPVLPAPGGPIAQRWEREFGRLPQEFLWPGRTSRGTWELNEDLRALTIQAGETTRLLQLGELTGAADEELTLRCDFSKQSQDGRVGLFFGLRGDNDDNPKWTRFQAIEFYASNNANNREVTVIQRYAAELVAASGRLNTWRGQHLLLPLTPNGENHRLEVHLRGPQIVSIQFAGEDCPLLVEPEFGSQFRLEDFAGAFGVYAHEATVWITNPSCQRHVQP